MRTSIVLLRQTIRLMGVPDCPPIVPPPDCPPDCPIGEINGCPRLLDWLSIGKREGKRAKVNEDTHRSFAPNDQINGCPRLGPDWGLG